MIENQLVSITKTLGYLTLCNCLRFLSVFNQFGDVRAEKIGENKI
jgi:hypothetical protein